MQCFSFKLVHLSKRLLKLLVLIIISNSTKRKIHRVVFFLKNPYIINKQNIYFPCFFFLYLDIWDSWYIIERTDETMFSAKRIKVEAPPYRKPLNNIFIFITIHIL